MKDEELDQEITKAKTRKAKLQQLAKLQRQIRSLEYKCFLSHEDLIGEFQRISEIVTKHYGVPMSCIAQRSNKMVYVLPRHVTLYLVRDKTRAPLSKIGAIIKRDHTTVLNACDRMEDRMSIDRKFAAEIDLLRKTCDAVLPNGNGHDK